MTKLFISDTHFNHNNILKYEDRPFDDIADMEYEFICNICKLYKPGDILYFLGDLVLSNRNNCIRILDLLYDIGIRNMHFIFGNHDYDYRNTISNHKVVQWSGDLKIIKIKGISTMLCHYPMRSWRVPYMLHGHSHGKFLTNPLNNSFDVSIDSAYQFFGEYRPFTEDEILDIMFCFNMLEDNRNLVETYHKIFPK